MGTAWNDFTKKIYAEGKKKNPSYKFSQALKDASKRKGEMGSSSSSRKRSKKGGNAGIMDESTPEMDGGRKRRTKRCGSKKRGTRKR
jgi:hypothetical protein